MMESDGSDNSGQQHPHSGLLVIEREEDSKSDNTDELYATKQANNDTRTLPASWFCSERIWKLERRAIYSKSWFMTTATSQFKEPGDYKVFEFAGYSIFLILDMDGTTINGFHNVCPHGGYPLSTKQSGCSAVMGCGYHAWSYNTKGELIKTPTFDKVDEFDKPKNSLIPINVHITRSGCIFVNLEAGEKPTIPFEEFFPGLEEILDGRNFKTPELYTRFEMVGNFNWKTRIDGYQECYHCAIAHKSLAKSFNMQTYAVHNTSYYTRHSTNVTSSNPDAWGIKDAVYLYLYPGGGLNWFGKVGWSRTSTSPMDCGKTKVYSEYYLDPNMAKDEKAVFVNSLRELLEEDFELCSKTQQNLNTGVYTRGVLNPRHESGVLHYQALTKKLVLDHAALEQSMGREINPATVVVDDDADDEFCRRLEKLAW